MTLFCLKTKTKLYFCFQKEREKRIVDFVSFLFNNTQLDATRLILNEYYSKLKKMNC